LLLQEVAEFAVIETGSEKIDLDEKFDRLEIFYLLVRVFSQFMVTESPYLTIRERIPSLRKSTEGKGSIVHDD